MPELPDVVWLLQRAPLFSGVASTDLNALASVAHCREVSAHDFFFKQGEAADLVYVLNNGRVKLTHSTADGLHIVLSFVGPTEMFGPTATFAGRSYPASAQAVRWCQALAWNGSDMARLMQRFPRVALNALSAMTSTLQELRERYSELATEPVQRRVAHTLIRLATQAGWKTEDGLLIDMPLSRQDVAEMTGTTLYTVSRILRGWKQIGVIDAGRERVTILQPAALHAIAQEAPDGHPAGASRRRVVRGGGPHTS
jgi:CRP-like cAMP-binding protein